MNQWNRLRKINSALLRRYGKGILIFLNIFWGVILLLLFSFIFEISANTPPAMVKQVIALIILLLIFGDLFNVLISVNVKTVLSISVFKIYPVSLVRKLKLIYYYYFTHSRIALILLPVIYIGYFYFELFQSFFTLFVIGTIILYFLSTVVITALFYLTELVKYKFGSKQIFWFFIPFLLVFVFGNDSTFIYDNFLINFLYDILQQLTL